MSLPDREELLSLEYHLFGLPLVVIHADQTQSLNSFDYHLFGEPVWGPPLITPVSIDKTADYLVSLPESTTKTANYSVSVSQPEIPEPIISTIRSRGGSLFPASSGPLPITFETHALPADLNTARRKKKEKELEELRQLEEEEFVMIATILSLL